MGKIVITTNISLDGVVEDPDGQEGFTLGGWFGQFGGKDLDGWAKVETEEALGAEALLLGRRSDEWFATRWLSRSGEWADKLNSMPKFAVSSTLKDAKWSNSTIINGDVVGEVRKLKQLEDARRVGGPKCLQEGQGAGGVEGDDFLRQGRADVGELGQPALAHQRREPLAHPQHAVRRQVIGAHLEGILALQLQVQGDVAQGAGDGGGIEDVRGHAARGARRLRCYGE